MTHLFEGIDILKLSKEQLDYLKELIASQEKAYEPKREVGGPK